MENKTHYRKVFKSDHLGVADLEDFIEEGKPLIFTTKEVKQEINVSVAGRKGNFNIAYFKEPIKPLVINATNGKIMAKFANGSPFVEDWTNIIIELYIDPSVKMKGDVVGGVRISPKKPTITINKPEFTKSNFEKAKQAKATIEKIKQIYDITPEVAKQYEEYAKQ